jgi:prevent-host-death family protein
MAVKRRTVNVHEAKSTLSRLLKRVQAGEEIVIARGGQPVARLVPLAGGGGERTLGFAAGQVTIAPDFDAPLPPDLLAAFQRADPA